MNTIRARVTAARRRLLMQRFGRVASWSLFALLLVAAIGVAIPKLWAIDVDPDVWFWAWAAGASAAGLVIAALVTFLTRPTLEDVALEVDRRFSLRERLSSTLALDPEARDTEIGRALIEDAERRAEKISIAERFALQPHRRALLPLIPIVFLAVMIFIPNATRENVAGASIDAATQQEAQQVKTVAQQLKKRLEQQRRKAEAEGLEEAEELFKKLERQAEAISKRDSIDKKEALIALNDIKKQLESRRDSLGSPDEMRKALTGLKDMDNGPAEKVARSLEKGDFGAAKEQIKELAEKLRDGKLTEQEKQQLAQQMDQLNKAIQDTAAKHEQAKQQLQQQIEQAKNQGRMEEAAKLQQQLDQLQRMDAQMQQMQQMAEGLQAAQQAMQQGNAQEAAAAMDQIAEQLGQMQEDLEQLEELKDAMDQLSQAKDQMGCKACNGQGCAQCQGMGQGMGQGKGMGQGDGLGQGTGQGFRPEEENDTNAYDSQVRGDPRGGRAVVAGFAGGENKKGVTRESVQEAVLQAISEESDPLETQALPRTEREHAQQYFDRLREGR